MVLLSLRFRQSPDHVSGHELVVGALLPPAPGAVAVLHIRQAANALAGDVVQLAGAVLAEQPLFHLSGVHTGTDQSLSHQNRRQEPAHGLFHAAVRVIDQVRQSFQHGGCQGRADPDVELGRAVFPFGRQVQGHGAVT